MGIVLHPIGGLANRLKNLASGLHLADDLGCEVSRVVWRVDNDVHAYFTDLFKSVPVGEMVSPAGWEYNLKYAIPRKQNLYIPQVYQRLRFGHVFSDSSNLFPLLDDHEEMRRLASGCLESGKDMYFISGQEFYDFPDSLLRRLFDPVDCIADEVARVTESFNPHTVGVHIRRTDHRLATKSSPDEVFIDAMNDRISAHDDANFYLATDDEAVKEKFIRLFPGRIITTSNPVTRRTLAGMRDAVKEMALLASTSLIIASYGSTFSHLASRIGGCGYRPLTV